MSIIDILEELESNSSRLFKENLLAQASSNTLLRDALIASYDPYINYYVSKFKMPPPQSVAVAKDDVQLRSFLDIILPTLSSRSVVGNEAKVLVVSAFQLMDARQQKWCLRVLLKNLRCGVQETTISKTWPGSISKFSVQLAESLSSHFEPNTGIVIDDKVKYPVRVEPKLDGLRCIIVKHSGEVTMFTRNGSVLETLPRIKASIESAPWDNFVLDGEALGEDWNESASVIMSHKKGKDDSNITYHVFDAMHFDDWRGQENSSKLSTRVDLIAELVEKLQKDSPVVQVGGKNVTTEEDLLKFYAECMDAGYEGIMVKDVNASYCFKRSSSVLKLKPVATYEGVVVGHYEGRRGSKREGLWGGFQIVMPNGIVTRVGGGFTDVMKAEINIDPESWIGRVIEVEGQPEPLTLDGLTRDGRVRFPVFIRERNKSDVDPKVIEAYTSYISKAQ
jgi:hypothetical protein